jgi:O-antigen ligase
MSRLETTLLYVLFAGSLLVEVRLPLVGFSAANLVVPAAALGLALCERASIAKALHAHRRLLLAALAVYAWAWVSAANGVLPLLSVRYVAKYGAHLVAFVALLVFLHRRSAVAPAQRAAYLVLAVLAVFAGVEYFRPDCALLTLFRNPSGRYPRVTSLLVSPNQLGVLSAIGVALGASLVGAGRLEARTQYSALPFFLLALAFSASRNGWLVLLVLVSTLTAVRVLTVRATAAIFVCLGMLLITFPVSTRQLGLKDFPAVPLVDFFRGEQVRRSMATNTPIEAMMPRFSLWKAALAEIERHPVSGIGLEAFANTIGPRITHQHWINTHNLFLNVSAELGLVGLALVLVFLFELWRCGDPRCWSTSIPLLGIGVGQLFDCFIYDHAFMAFTAFFSACYASVPRAPG